jgi:hypothetical protein
VNGRKRAAILAVGILVIIGLVFAAEAGVHQCEGKGGKPKVVRVTGRSCSK